jgi:hypothetical protein
MLYNRGNPSRLDDPIEPTGREVVHPVPEAYDGPHWGWFVAVFALFLLGLIAIGIGGGGDTQTAAYNAPATTGSAQ